MKYALTGTSSWNRRSDRDCSSAAISKITSRRKLISLLHRRLDGSLVLPDYLH